MAKVAQMEVTLIFSKLVASDAEGNAATVFGDTLTSDLEMILANIDDTIDPNIFVEIGTTVSSVITY